MTDSRSNYCLLEDARSQLRSRLTAHDRVESVSLEQAVDRVIAEPVVADRDVPHYRRAAMDGYAVRSTETDAASPQSPVVLTETDSAVQPGTARYVDTGSEIPDGADAVARVEKVEQSGTEIRVLEPIEAGKDVAPVGEDVAAGTRLYAPDTRLHPADLAVLKSVGIRSIRVRERPTVAVIPTGEELVASDPEPGQVVETNGLMVSRMVDGWGGESTYRDIVTDDEQALEAAIQRDLDHDIVVTTGGSSAGKRDLLPGVIERLGELYVHHVAIKPGHPVGLGEIEGTTILVLPGYPVACLLNAVQFLRPALAWLEGVEPPPVPTTKATLAEAVNADPGVRRFERVRVEHGETGATARPVTGHGAGVLTSVSESDGWVVVDEETETIRAGESVLVEHWDGCR